MHTHAPLIIDVAGFELTDADHQRLAHPLVGGIILFGRNWQSREQLTGERILLVLRRQRVCLPCRSCRTFP